MTQFDKLFNNIINEELNFEEEKPQDNFIEVDEKNWKDDILKKYPDAEFKYFLPGQAKTNSGTMATIDNMVVGATGGHFMHKTPWKAYIFKSPITREEFGNGINYDWYK